jgi:two-component system chemotaxis response regulator CheV
MNNILLESGTNEVEILEYIIDGQEYGINVLKVQQIIETDKVSITKTPNSENTIGVVLHQGESIPILNINDCLGDSNSKTSDLKKLIIITEFNLQINGIIVDSVNKIHRISWDSIKRTSLNNKKEDSIIVGVCHIDDRQLLLLDYESILSSNVNNINIEDDSPIMLSNRSDKTVLFADDSNLIRKTLGNCLNNMGYKNIKSFDNGKSLLDYFKNLVDESIQKNKKITDLVDIVLTDIEMPQLDGLTLCKEIKNITKDVPVIIISSLINSQMIEKCISVKANNYISKKDLQKIEVLLDQTLSLTKPIRNL